MVRDVAGNLDPAIHRAGMHHKSVGFASCQSPVIQPVKVEILACRGNEVALHPFILQPQHHDHIGALQRLVEIGESLCSKSFDTERHKRRRCDHTDIGPQVFEAKYVRPGNAAVQNIAADYHGLSFNAAFAARNGERVEQSLCRMFMAAIACIKHWTIYLA